VKFPPDIFGSTIVALGSFNPVIFTPQWLCDLGLIGKDDRDAAVEGEDGFVVSRQVTAFSTDWFGLQVNEQQFTLASNAALSPAFFDLAQSIFSQVPHTPVTAIGLNFMGHYPLQSEARYHQFGDALAPKGFWHSAFPGDRAAGLAELQIVIEQGKRGEVINSKDRVTVQVQKSSKVKLGIFLSLNDHRANAFDSQMKAANAQTAALVLGESWEAAWKESERAFEALLDGALIEPEPA